MCRKEKEQQVREALCDEESRVYFQARQELAREKGLFKFYQRIRENKVSYKFRDIASFLEDKDIAGWCVWGMDDVGLYHSRLLRDAGFGVSGIIHIGKDAKVHTDVPLLSVKEGAALVNKKNHALLISSDKVGELPETLRDSGNILEVEHHLVGRCGWQYFDYFSPREKEVFIDGGALDGATSKEFMRWCGGGFERIYAFEPNPLVSGMCRENLQKYGEGRVLFWEKALWKERGRLLFDNSSKSRWDACLSGNGNAEVECITIDEAVKGDKVTFVKLDVEGGELEALMGAKECIKTHKPRMAVSIYHKDFDYVDIPYFLLSIHPSYRFSIRHYHSDCIETILYAF